MVRSADVEALVDPPDFFTNRLYSLSSGYFSLPRKHMCSQKCANPGSSHGSLMCPTLTVSAAAALSALASLISATRILLGSVMHRYSRSSAGDLIGVTGAAIAQRYRADREVLSLQVRGDVFSLVRRALGSCSKRPRPLSMPW